MAKVMLNQYKGVYQDNHSEFVVAESMVDGAEALTSLTEEPVYIHRTQTNIGVITPDLVVQFRTEVSPPEAGTTGCVATPPAYTVRDQDEVILSAIPALGWEFNKWTFTKAGTTVDLTDPAVSRVLIDGSGNPSNEVLVYTAVFVPIP